MERSETITIRPLTDLGKLPATISVELPIDVGVSLIRRRLCSPVGDLSLQPDLVVNEDGLQHVGCDLWSIAA